MLKIYDEHSQNHEINKSIKNNGAIKTIKFMVSVNVFHNIFVFDTSKNRCIANINGASSTKYDLFYRDLEINRQVERIEGEHFSSKNSLLFFETSAKTASNIPEVFEELAKHLYRKVLSGEIDVTRPVRI